MLIQQLAINSVRNLSTLELSPCAGFNALVGPNGSGKTSILEAIYILSRGRSFRTRQIERVINDASDQMLVRAEILDEQAQPHQTAVQRLRTEKKSRFRVDGEDVQSAAQLSETLPVQLLYTESDELLTSGPQGRRQFIDWGLFHVEQSFFDEWRRFRRALEQRNALLRRGRMSAEEYASWEQLMASAATKLNTLRIEYLEELKPLFRDVVTALQPSLSEIELEYQAGWNSKEDYSVQLRASFEKDLKYRATTVGPHRADMPINLRGEAASQRLSRGQIKIVVYALKIAQGLMLKQKTGRSCIYLLDDAPAELDQNHQLKVVELLSQLESQVFVTGVQLDIVSGQQELIKNSKMFHVEHGQIS